MGILVNGWKRVLLAGDGLTALDFTTVSGTLVKTTVADGIRWGAGPGYGITTKKIAAGNAGKYRCTYKGSGYKDFMIGLAVNNTNNDYLTYDAGIGVEAAGSTYVYMSVGTLIGTGIAAVTGDWLEFDVDSGHTHVLGRKSSNNGGSWTTIFDYGAAAVDLFPKGTVISNPNYILEPRHSGMT